MGFCHHQQNIILNWKQTQTHLSKCFIQQTKSEISSSGRLGRRESPSQCSICLVAGVFQTFTKPWFPPGPTAEYISHLPQMSPSVLSSGQWNREGSDVLHRTFPPVLCAGFFSHSPAEREGGQAPGKWQSHAKEEAEVPDPGGRALHPLQQDSNTQEERLLCKVTKISRLLLQ